MQVYVVTPHNLSCNIHPLPAVPAPHVAVTSGVRTAELRISPRVFKKIRNGLNRILWGWGETDSCKESEAKNLVTLSLYRDCLMRWIWLLITCMVRFRPKQRKGPFLKFYHTKIVFLEVNASLRWLNYVSCLILLFPLFTSGA
jgi:hypothetical protein